MPTSDIKKGPLYVDSTNNRVGIGTSSPEGLIGLPATASNTPKFRLQSASTNTDFAISSYADANGTYVSLGANYYLDSGGNDAVFETTDRSAYVFLDARNHGMVSFGTNSSGVATERMRITSGGSVGIGTSSPVASSLLTLKETNAGGDGAELRLINSSTTVESATQIVFTNTTTDTADSAVIKAVRTAGGQDFRFSSDGTERMRIDSSGNVGIGVAPSELLHIKNASGDAAVRIDGNTRSFKIEQNNYGLRFVDVSGGSAERMRITASGDVLVASTSILDMWRGLGQDGTHIGSSYCASQYGSNNNLYMSKPSGATDLTYISFWVNGGGVGNITTSGSSTAYNTSSDYRLKTAVTYDWDATTRLKQLKPARFEWIADGDDAVPVDGFLAHEVQDVVPEAITGTKDAMRDEEYEVTPAVLDEDGNEVTPAVMGTRSVPDYQGIDQSKLTPLLTKALIEAVEKIEQLEARIAALEAS